MAFVQRKHAAETCTILVSQMWTNRALVQIVFNSKVKSAAWPRSSWPPGTDRHSLRPKVNSCMWFNATDDSTVCQPPPIQANLSDVDGGVDHVVCKQLNCRRWQASIIANQKQQHLQRHLVELPLTTSHNSRTDEVTDVAIESRI